MVDARGTVTTAEHRALDYLAGGPALLGPATGTVTRRPLPALFDRPNLTLTDAALTDAVKAADRRREVDRVVETKAARRLAARGLVTIEHGLATLAVIPEAPSS